MINRTDKIDTQIYHLVKKRLRQPSEYQPAFLLAGQLLVSNFQKGGVKESGLKEFLPLIFAWGLTMFLVRKDFVKENMVFVCLGRELVEFFSAWGKRKNR